MSAEIPPDTDASHPEQAPERRARPSNLSHTQRKKENESKRKRDHAKGLLAANATILSTK